MHLTVLIIKSDNRDVVKWLGRKKNIKKYVHICMCAYT